MNSLRVDSAQRITVVIVDDHAVVRQGVRVFLETQSDVEVIGEAASGAEAVELCSESAPDVVLMDLVMPAMDGVEATRAVKRISPRTHVIVLTSYHDDEHILPAIRAGALSYLLKDVTADELADAVRKAARGEGILHPHVASKVIASLHRSDQRDEDSELLAALTDRELEVLCLIAEGLSNSGIAERLVISEKTVKSHVGNILSKLHLVDRTQAAVYAWRTGVMNGSA
jgi:two-component system, NarL family, response regulator LiaR